MRVDWDDSTPEEDPGFASEALPGERGYIVECRGKPSHSITRYLLW